MACFRSHKNTYGLGVVINRASAFPACFENWMAGNCESVEELPLGTCVLVLPQVESDMGWAPVLVEFENEVRFSWHHPDCIRLLEQHELDSRKAFTRQQRNMI